MPIQLHLLRPLTKQQLTPCLQACSFRALTQVLCQCSLMDLKENRVVNRPLTPASDAGPPSLPVRSFSRKPHTAPVRLWWGSVRESCGRAGSLFTCPVGAFLAFRSRSRVSAYWSSHPSTMNTEARKRATRHSQPNSRSSISVFRSLSYHQVQMVNTRTVSQGRSASFSLRVAAVSVSFPDTSRTYKL